jgi:hypothetical protein
MIVESIGLRKVLAEQGLETNENCSQFIDYYQGNPLWLKKLISWLN